MSLEMCQGQWPVGQSTRVRLATAQAHLQPVARKGQGAGAPVTERDSAGGSVGIHWVTKRWSGMNAVSPAAEYEELGLRSSSQMHLEMVFIRIEPNVGSAAQR